MALLKPTYCGVDNIMSAYDSINGDCQYYYSVWHSQKDIAFQYVGDDARKAREYLESNLRAMEQSGNDNLLYLKFHPAKKKAGEYITYKTDVIANTPICCLELPEGAVTGERGTERERNRENDQGYNVYKMRLFMEELPTKLETMIEEKISSKIGAIGEEDDEPEIDPVDKYIGIINGIVSNPQIMGMVGQILNFLKPQPVVPPVRINGMTNDQDKGNVTEPVSANVNDQQSDQETPISEDMLNEALGRLSAHCRIDTDLLLLADMADNEPGQFQFLLNMLRKR